MTGRRTAARPQAPRRDVLRDPVHVLRGLPGDPGERLPLLLRLESADGCPIDEEEVVSAPVAGREHEFPNGDTAGGAEIGGAVTLNGPASRGQHLVDANACLSLRREV